MHLKLGVHLRYMNTVCKHNFTHQADLCEEEHIVILFCQI